MHHSGLLFWKTPVIMPTPDEADGPYASPPTRATTQIRVAGWWAQPAKTPWQ